jgi:two-component sensor histidine kinase
LANKYLPVHAALCRKIGNPVAIKYNIRLQFMLDSAEGHYKAAMFHLQQYHQINDSLFNETKSKQFKQAEVEYETEKKENDLKLRDRDIRLLKQENLLQQGRLQQANLVKNVTIGSIAMLFVIMGLLYRQYLIKQKSNRLITEKNELLQHLLAEKEWLLKEVHHRVKNNLHTVICLLESQAANLESDALSEMENTQHRIYAMSLIHQKLYQSEDLKTIDMSIFLPDLMRYMKDGLDGKRRIHFRLDIAPVKLGVAQAIPIALIINEAVTNAIKYAFVGREGGLIELSMCQENDQVALQINDNGIGIDPAIVHAPSDSLGLKLIHGLSEDINASIHIENENGTKIRVVFDLDPLNDPALYESKKTQMKVSR